MRMGRSCCGRAYDIPCFRNQCRWVRDCSAEGAKVERQMQAHGTVSTREHVHLTALLMSLTLIATDTCGASKERTAKRGRFRDEFAPCTRGKLRGQLNKVLTGLVFL